MIEDFPELLESSVDVETNFTRKQLKDIELIEKSIKRRHCNKATLTLKRFIGTDSSGEHFSKVMSLSRDIDACFSRRGSRARLKFWYRLEESLNSTYGFLGKELAGREKGLLYWNLDEFEEAKEIFRRLVDTSEKFPELAARNLHTLARIYENEGDYKAAISNYASFIRQFPNDEKVTSTYTSLILLNHLIGQTATAIYYAKEVIDKQTLKPYDDRDSGNLAFALFWYASLNLNKGHYEKAFDYWRRLSQEYFSTFYGALGHYMLEQWFNKPLAFGAGVGKQFQPEKLQRNIFQARSAGVKA
jgi:tetratricopeptide (TPR) repeat protein